MLAQTPRERLTSGLLEFMRLGPPPRPTRVVDLLNPAAVLLPAANVIMQLASPAVGYAHLHQEQQKALLEQAFGKLKGFVLTK